jgi:hypothetical protein
LVYNGGQTIGEARRMCNHLLASMHSPIESRRAMSKAILAAISHLPQLRSSLRTTAQRLAYYADSSGRCAKAHTYLAKDMHISERTVYRHIARLEALGILVVQRLRRSTTRCAINVYTFLVGVHKRAPDRVAGNQAKREKIFAREEEKPTLNEAGARWLAMYRRFYPLEE